MDTGDYIRLLDLLPGEPEDDIRCDVRVVILADGEPYEALSYVWGDYKDLREINVAGEPISVTWTLYAALQRLRNPEIKRTLWADQLCIDQWDVVQKTHQVNKMRDIYRGCSQCLLWFGDIVENMGQFGVQDAVVALDFVQLCSGYYENPDGSKPVPASLADPQQLDGAVKAFEALTMMGNTWWRRIWTVQEAVIPRKAVIIWGPLSFPWSTIMRAAWDLCVPYRALPPLDILIKFNHLLGGFTAPVRGLELAQKGEDPLRLLQRWRYREATDPRDKVYALMGLFKSMPFPSIQSCNYDIPVVSLYTTVTVDLIRMEQNLKPLVGIREAFTPGLPTWALDFAGVPKMEASLWWWDSERRYRWFSTDGGEPLRMNVIDAGRTLSLRGIFVDTIKEVGEVQRAVLERDISIATTAETLNSWERMLLQHTRSPVSTRNYANGDSWSNAFWRTVIGDLILDHDGLAKRRATFKEGHEIMEFSHGIKTYLDIAMRASINRMIVNQAFFITKTGYIGIGPAKMRPGDQVWVLFGSKVPFVLRRRGDGISQEGHKDGCEELTLVGGAFTYGIMDGEIVNRDRERQTAVRLS